MHYERTWCTSVYKNQLVDKMVIRRDILKRINLYWKINFDFTNILTAIAAVLGTLPYHELCKNNMKSLEKNTRSVSYFFILPHFISETKIANLISSIFSKTFSEEKKISKNSCYQTFVPIMILYENPEINVIFFYIVLFFIWLDKKRVDFLLALINPR